MSEKTQWHYGLKFTRDDSTGYYLNSTIGERAHRFVWKKERGEIPDGFHIHHIDADKSNNDISNLQALPASQHISEHMFKYHGDEQNKEKVKTNLENIRHLTKEWHSSEEGIEWHRKQASECFQKREFRTEICSNCAKEFSTKSFSITKFCCNACKSAHRRKLGVDNEERVCEFCKNKFTVDRYSKARVCSRACSNRLRFKLKHLASDIKT